MYRCVCVREREKQKESEVAGRCDLEEGRYGDKGPRGWLVGAEGLFFQHH